MPSTSGLTIHDVRKRFTRRGRWVLCGVDLDLEAGTATVIVGGNGSGKSTLLRIAAGLCRPTTGQAIHPSPIGYVPERQPARLRMSGSEYVAHMGRIRGMDGAAVGSRSAELFDRLGLKPGPDVAVDSLSKGNRQKVLLSQALLAPVSLLVLDEPFTGLDADSAPALFHILSEVQDAGTAVLISTHQATSLPASFRTLHLVDGVVGELSAAEVVGQMHPFPGVHVVLRPGEPAGDWDTMAMRPGVLSARHDGSRGIVTLTVDPECREPLLSEAITSGWHVLYVGMTAPRPQDLEEP
ncbi:MAG TPA: ABC transporter ATP-binding protein [Acidimicrobiales bacterium]|nr:ABC transporter ATP-binding protein [Acidimicrobiales bacterium]